jgi:hypothetical protein
MFASTLMVEGKFSLPRGSDSLIFKPCTLSCDVSPYVVGMKVVVVRIV